MIASPAAGCIAPEVTSNTGAPLSIPIWPSSAIPVRLPFDSTSLALFALASGYDPDSVHNTRSSLPSDLSKLNQEFRQSLAGGLRDNTMGSYSVHVNHYRQLCEARNLPALPLTYERIAEYCFYHIVFKPFPPNKAHGNYHSTNALKQVCAALTGYAFSQGSPPLNVDESKALSTYCNRTLPRAYPPGTTPRYPVRLALLEEARVAREARAAADPSLAWAALRDTTYFMVAHQGLFRRTELINMRSSDIRFAFRSGNPSPVSITLTIRVAKTSNVSIEDGEQPVQLDARPDTPTYCCVSHLIRWFKTLNLIDGSYRVLEDRTLWPALPLRLSYPTTGSAMLAILRSDMKAVGVPIELLPFFTNHGLRTGGAQDFFNSQVDREALLLHGRWKSLAWLSYLKLSPESTALPLSLGKIALTSEPSLVGKALASDAARRIDRIFALKSTASSVLNLTSSPLGLPPSDHFPSPTSVVDLNSFSFKPSVGLPPKRSRITPPSKAATLALIDRSSPIQPEINTGLSLASSAIALNLSPILDSDLQTSGPSLANSAPSPVTVSLDRLLPEISPVVGSNQTRALFVPRQPNALISAPPAGTSRIRTPNYKFLARDFVYEK